MMKKCNIFVMLIFLLGSGCGLSAQFKTENGEASSSHLALAGGPGGDDAAAVVPARVPEVAPEAESVEGSAGAERRDYIRVGGKKYALPSGYTVAISRAAADAEGDRFGDDPPDTKPLGSGSAGIAYLAKNAAGQLMVVKFDRRTLDSKYYGPTFPESLATTVRREFERDDVNVARSMQARFGNEMEAEGLDTANGIPVVVKTAIVGDGAGTLKGLLADGTFTGDSEAAQSMRDSLKGLFDRMGRSRRIYGDLNPANLMWNGRGWVVIDAKPPRLAASDEDARVGNLDSFLEKLPIGKSQAFYQARVAFFQKLNRGAYLPTLADPNLYEKARRFVAEVEGLKDDAVRQRRTAFLRQSQPLQHVREAEPLVKHAQSVSTLKRSQLESAEESPAIPVSRTRPKSSPVRSQTQPR